MVARKDDNGSRRFNFTDGRIDRLPFTKSGQVTYTDSGCKGLWLVVGKTSKSFKTQFKLGYQWQTRTLRPAFGQNCSGSQTDKAGVEWARAQCGVDRGAARVGTDPRQRDKLMPHTGGKRFEHVVEEYLAVAKQTQRSFSDTHRVLTKYCLPIAWKPMPDITDTDVQAILDLHVAKGHTRTAQTILVKLKTLWKWARKPIRKYVQTAAPENCEVTHLPKERSRVYSDAELKALWQASDKLDPVQADFTKLLILLAPRKTALAKLEVSHLNLTAKVPMWTTPFELVKAKKTAKRRRVYKTPLPPLALQILQRRLAALGEDEVLVFPIHGAPLYPGSNYVRPLVKAGAPKGFAPHQLRHTIGTWFEDHGHSEWERGLLLNHASSSVTAGYSHGSPDGLKLALLTKWEEHLVGVIRGSTTTHTQEDPDAADRADYQRRQYADLLSVPAPVHVATYRAKDLLPVAPTAARRRAKQAPQAVG